MVVVVVDLVVDIDGDGDVNLPVLPTTYPASRFVHITRDRKNRGD